MSMKPILALTMVCALLLACHNGRVRSSEEEAYALLEQVAELNAGGDKQGALLLADSALTMHPADTTRCWLLSERAVALTDMGRMDEAIQTGRTALELAERSHDIDATLNMHGALGIAYRRLGHADSALTEYEKGIELAVKEQNREYEIYLDNCVSVLFSEEGRWAEALTYAQKAESAAAAANDTIERLSAKANIGGICMRQGKFREALQAVLPVWHTADSIGYNVLTLKFLSVILKSYAALNDLPRFEEFMLKADSVVRQSSPSSAGVLGILEIKADMMGRQGRYADQLVVLDTLAAMGNTNRAMPEERMLSERAKCLEALGRHAEALSTMERAYHLLDSVKQSDVERSMSEFTVKYRTLEKDMHIEQMKRETLALENRLLWLAVCAVLLLIALCVMLYRRKIARQRAELAERRSYISGLESERERLAKELHDGVCNDILATTLLLATDSQRAEAQLRDVWKEVRHLSHALMPPRFKDVRLDEAVRAYAASLTGDVEDKVVLDIDGQADWKRLSQQEAYETYRIIQEATMNALKHGDDSRVTIALTMTNGEVVASVANEVKAESTAATSGIGLKTMEQRAAAIGGRLTAETTDGRHIVKLTYRLP